MTGRISAFPASAAVTSVTSEPLPETDRPLLARNLVSMGLTFWMELT
jgi:hypothetical protein